MTEGRMGFPRLLEPAQYVQNPLHNPSTVPETLEEEQWVNIAPSHSAGCHREPMRSTSRVQFGRMDFSGVTEGIEQRPRCHVPQTIEPCLNPGKAVALSCRSKFTLCNKYSHQLRS